MSFLNPVNEPVLRFSSTDAGAPQINYNSRVAGDVKAVLKACLVTGYGAKASAGWSIANEVNHVAEFVSPSAAMNDYRLGVDDSSASSTTWYYQYQDARLNPVRNTLAKNRAYGDFNKTSAKNGWQLLVTQKGIFYIEIIDSTVNGDTVARLLYWGQCKSALADDGINVSFWNLGHASENTYAHNFFARASTEAHYRLAGYNSLNFSSANISAITSTITANQSAIAAKLVSTLYLQNSNGFFVAEQPGIMLQSVSDITRPYGVYDTAVGDRPAISICLIGETGSLAQHIQYARTVLVYLDYWEY